MFLAYNNESRFCQNPGATKIIFLLPIAPNVTWNPPVVLVFAKNREVSCAALAANPACKSGEEGDDTFFVSPYPSYRFERQLCRYGRLLRKFQ